MPYEETTMDDPEPYCHTTSPVAESNESRSDPWTAKSYQASSSFVPLLTTQVVQWLDPNAGEQILDLGCGDGILTANLRERCRWVCGLDGSPNLIQAARQRFGHIRGIDWEVQDCRYLEAYAQTKKFDKIFSNAALHWILRDATTRQAVIKNCFDLLMPNGTFVFEMGGAGNCAEVHVALISALVHHGVTIEKAREACPWFFPSEYLMRRILESEGFRVEKAEVQYRPTKMTTEEGGGLGGWIRLHGDSFLQVLRPELRDEVVEEVSEALRSAITREEDGSMWIGYVRLRMLARKPK